MPSLTWIQPRKMSLVACISRCPTTTRCPWFLNWLLADVLLEHRLLRLLELQEQRILAVAAEKQGNPRSRPDAADAHDLPREVRQLELLEQLAPVVIERHAIDPDQLAQLVHPLLLLSPWDEHAERHDQRRLIDDLGRSVDLLRELRERGHAVAGVRLGQDGLCPLDLAALDLGRELLQDRLDLQVRVPDLEVLHPGEVAHRRAVLASRVEHDLLLVLGGESVVPCRDQHARAQPLDVPLPWSRNRLVEVVDVEHELSLGRREHPEVR